MTLEPDYRPVGRPKRKTVEVGSTQTMPWIHNIDQSLLDRYRDILLEQQELRKILAKDGPILTEPVLDRQGNKVGERKVSHPANALLRQTDRALNAIAAQAGLSPQARIKLGLVMSQTVLTNQQLIEEMNDA